MKNTNPRQHVVTGQPLRPPAAGTMNALLDLLGPQTGDGRRGRRATSIEIDIQNNTGTDLAAFAPVEIGGPTIAVDSVESAFAFGVLMAGTTPTADTTNIAITQEPIADGAIGRAVVFGVVAVRLNVSAEADSYGSPTATTAELTTNSTGGPLRILSKQAGTGTGKWGTGILLGVTLADAQVISLDYVAKACVSRVSGGMISNITFEHRKLRLLGVPLADETYCTNGDDDCCPTVEVPCCEEPVPRLLTLTITAGGELASYNGLQICFEAANVSGNTIWCPIGANYPPGVVWVHSERDEDGNVTWLIVSSTFDPEIRPSYMRIAAFGCFSGSWLSYSGVGSGIGFIQASVRADPFPAVTCQLCEGDAEAADEGAALYSFLDEDLLVPNITCSPFAIVNDGSRVAAFCDSIEGVPSGVCGAEGAADFSLSFVIAASTGDCGLLEDEDPGVEPDPDGCCPDTGDLVLTTNGTGDFVFYGNVASMTYDPSGIAATFAVTTPTYDGRFQWYGNIGGGDVVLYFGCLDGVYYYGFGKGAVAGDLPEWNCFTWEAEADMWVSNTTTAEACESGTVATFTITGDGTSGCTGTLEFLITR